MAKFGNATSETLDGTSGDDTIYGLAGDDTLNGSGGNDILFGDTILSGNPFVGSQITRVSTDSGGGQIPYFGGTAWGGNVEPVFSPDGTKLAFWGANLQNGLNDIFIKNLVTGTLTDAVHATSYIAPLTMSFSPDGTKLVFTTDAQLVAQDTNFTNDVYIANLTTGALTLVSTNSSGVLGDAGSQNPQFSPDGTKVVFDSSATNLVTGDTNGVRDIFLKDLQTGTVTRVSQGTLNEQGSASSASQPFGSTHPVFSPDGTMIAFQSDDNGLTADTPLFNQSDQIYVKILTNNILNLESQYVANTNHFVGNSRSISASFSPGSDQLVFSSAALNFPGGNPGGHYQIYLKNLVTQNLSLESELVDGSNNVTIGNGDSYAPVFSPNGHFILFSTYATNLFANDTNGSNDVVIKSPSTQELVLLSQSAAGVLGDGQSGASSQSSDNEAVFSPDGSLVAFASGSDNLVPNDTNVGWDIFAVTLGTSPYSLAGVSSASGDDTLNGGVGDDQLFGGLGHDTLNGGADRDVLVGGGDADKFVFDSAALTDAQSGSSVIDQIRDYDRGDAAIYNAGEGDQIDVSALTGTAFGGGQLPNALVRVVDHPSNAFGLLQVDSDGTANGIHWTTLAKIDGLHGSQSVNGILAGSQPGGSTFFVLSNDGHFGDFDGDGKADLVWRNDNGTVATWQMNGGTVSAGNFITTVSSDWHILGTGDFNADGKADILWQNDNGSLLDWQMASASQIGSTPGLGTAPANSFLAGIGDVDHDGKSDLLWRDSSTGAVTINTMAGGSNTISGVGNDWSVVGVGDYNGDAMADVMFRNQSQGINAAWLLNGTNLSSTVFFPGVPNDWHVEGSGDFDGNGTADLFWHNDNGANAVWLMNTSGGIAQAGFFSGVGSDWHVVGTGDFDGDLKDDIVWRNDGGATAVWQMNGVNAPTVSFPGGTPTDWATQAHHYDYV